MKYWLAACLAVVPMVWAAEGALAQREIVRESSGQRRAELDRMELQPFPAVWDALGDWAWGRAVRPAELSGKPVLFVNWAQWHPTAGRALALGQQMAEKFGPQGLVVIGVHHPVGWEGAAEAAAARGARFPIVHDRDGAYRRALKVAHEPEYYIMDRAGHLRYASVAGGSLEAACAEVVAETVEQAGDVPRIRRQREEEARRKTELTRNIRTEFDLRSLPPVPPGYNPPPPAAYDQVREARLWPRPQSMNRDLARAWGLLDQNDKPLEPKLNFQPLHWFPRRPEMTGRVLVIYYWHPDVHLSYARAMPEMDLLQEQNLRDLVVIGAMIPLRLIDPNRARSGVGQPDEETFERLQAKWESFTRARQYSHALAVDMEGTSVGTGSQMTGMQNFPVPGGIIVSTDGTIRWVGGLGTVDFRSALDAVLANDPGVQARRAADQAFIENLERRRGP